MYSHPDHSRGGGGVGSIYSGHTGYSSGTMSPRQERQARQAAAYTAGTRSMASQSQASSHGQPPQQQLSYESYQHRHPQPYHQPQRMSPCGRVHERHQHAHFDTRSASGSGSPHRSWGGSPRGVASPASPRDTARERLAAKGFDVNAPPSVGLFEALKRAVDDGDIQAAKDIVHSEVLDTESLGNLFVWACGLANPYRANSAVRLLIDAGVFVNVRSDTQQTPLMAAAAAGNQGICEVLIGHGAMKDALDMSRRTAYHIAMEKGRDDTCCYLLDKGADPGVSNTQGYSTLMFAAVCGCPKTCLRILDMTTAYYDLHAIKRVDPHQGWTALGLAISHRLVDVAAALLARGASVSTRDKEGVTPLVLAIEEGFDDLAKQLLKRSAPLIAKITKPGRTCGWTPLHVAVDCGNLEITRAILERGGRDLPADVHARTDDGATALLLSVAKWAARPQQQRDIFTLLLAKGADINACDKAGMAALHHAVLNDSGSLLAEVVRAGADVNLRDSRRRTPLIIAVANRRVDMATALVAAGVDVNKIDASGATPLRRAVRLGPPAMRTLLERAGGVMRAPKSALDNASFAVSRTFTGVTNMSMTTNDLGLSFAPQSSGITDVCGNTIGAGGVPVGSDVASTVVETPQIGVGVPTGAATMALPEIVVAAGTPVEDAPPRLPPPAAAIVEAVAAAADAACIGADADADATTAQLPTLTLPAEESAVADATGESDAAPAPPAADAASTPQSAPTPVEEPAPAPAPASASASASVSTPASSVGGAAPENTGGGDAEADATAAPAADAASAGDDGASVSASAASVAAVGPAPSVPSARGSAGGVEGDDAVPGESTTAADAQPSSEPAASTGDDVSVAASAAAVAAEEVGLDDAEAPAEGDTPAEDDAAVPASGAQNAEAAPAPAE